jgi:hypothetical protein
MLVDQMPAPKPARHSDTRKPIHDWALFLHSTL